ncbi:prepilin-type N-terminal cleavage/methylation domain-containing protein [Patescibacteria group bacterium]|nr:prepilin-type N-terminal cleavage/methylation domain-containing protein [Patescibacteria group bacterium]
MAKKNKNKGMAIIEVLVALGIFSIIAGSLLVLMMESFDLTRQSRMRAEAESFAQEGIEAARSIQRRSWNEIVAGTHGLDDSAGYWVLSGSSNARGTYTRVLAVEDVYRDSLGDIVAAGEGGLDIWTKKLTSRVDWIYLPGRPNYIIHETYLYNWKSENWRQHDWSGGSGQATWSDETKYWSDDGSIDNATASEIKLAPGALGKMETGSASVDHNWVTVNLAYTYDNPVVVATVWESNNTIAMSTRVRNATSTSFELRLHNPSGDTIDAQELVFYTVVEEGAWLFSDNTKIEAHKYDTSTVGASSLVGGTWVANSKTYTHVYSSAPALLHQVMTDNDPSWISTWTSAVGSPTAAPTESAFQIGLNGAEVTASHGSETIGWIAIEAAKTGAINAKNYETVVTAKAIAGHDNGCYMYPYNNTYSAGPIIVAAQEGMAGSNGSWLVACSHSDVQAGFHAEEDQAYDSERSHGSEVGSYVAFETGFKAYLDTLDFQMEVDQVVVSNNWATVNLKNTYTNPVVVAFYEEANNTLPGSTRVRNASGNSFDIRLHNPSGAVMAADTIFYMVVEQGSWLMPDGTKIEAHKYNTSTVGSKAGGWSGDSKTYGHTYSSAPVVLHQVMSNSDSTWITSWVSSPSSRSSPPTVAGFQISLNGASVTATHGAEDIGWVAIEAGKTSSIDSALFETQITSDSIEGHDNGCYTFSFNQSYTYTPLIIAAQQEMDGTDGAWLVGCSLSQSQAGFHAEEDQVGDSERSHGSETGAFAAFSKPFSVAGQYQDYDWPFSVAGNYTYDPLKIEVTGGYAQLQPGYPTDKPTIRPTSSYTTSDLISWVSFEETAIKDEGCAGSQIVDHTEAEFNQGVYADTQWNTDRVELTAAGKTNGIGTYTSRIFNVGAVVSWDNISWEPNAPYGKALPDNGASEVLYADGNANMNSTAVLFHFNESAGASVFGDTSGNSNNGSCSGDDCPTAEVTGKYKTALDFDGNDDYVEIDNTIGNDFTLEAWIKTSAASATGTQCYHGDGLFWSDVGGYVRDDWILGVLNNKICWWTGNPDNQAVSGASINDGQWHHVVATRQKGGQKGIYIDGFEDGNYSTNGNTLDDNPIIRIGGNPYDNHYFDGIMDEVVIYSRVLLPEEILDRYKRGALALGHQVRSCDDAVCLGEAFIGPDGTGADYYSEEDNGTITLPSFAITNVSDNQYFQYQSTFVTGDDAYTPELASLTVDYGCAGSGSAEVYYQLSNDNGSTWQYWDGASWSLAGSANYNTSEEVDYNIGDFSISGQRIMFKAFLESDGSQQVKLDNVNIGHRYSSSGSGYVTSGELESSAYDTGAPSNFNIISWDETLPIGAVYDIKLQIKTAPDSGGSPGAWSSTWCGPQGEDGDETDYFNTSSSGEFIHPDHGGDQWIKYKAMLQSDGADTPVLDWVNVNYQNQ